MKTKSIFLKPAAGIPFVAALLFAGAAQAQPEPTNASYRVVGTYISGASDVLPSAVTVKSPLQFESSDAQLAAGFQWAKAQAMACVFDDDAVGPWYEAAEPGREAFCMRDTAHQAMGAQALGLARYNFNMLRHFAAAVSRSRDWCSYWEIDRYGRPAPVDYENDDKFWFNLPANFDVLDCCFRMYVWTGDLRYANDPVFLNFYSRTMNDYAPHWKVDAVHIMTRPRLMNVHGTFDPNGKFQKNRGIPGYDEGDHTYIVGFDVLATERAACLGYAHFQEIRRNAKLAQVWLDKAAQLEQLATNKWWDASNQCFYARLNKGYQPEGRARRSLDWGDTVSRENPDALHERLLTAAFDPRSRREYPEIPFSWIGDLVNGTMGINLEFTSPLESAVKGNWVEVQIKTMSGLGTNVVWAELHNLPVRANVIGVRHEGARKTVFTNQHGPGLIWRAEFPGAHPTVLVNGRPMSTQTETDAAGRQISWVRVIVGPGGRSTVEVPE